MVHQARVARAGVFGLHVFGGHQFSARPLPRLLDSPPPTHFLLGGRGRSFCNSDKDVAAAKFEPPVSVTPPTPLQGRSYSKFSARPL